MGRRLLKSPYSKKILSEYLDRFGGIAGAARKLGHSYRNIRRWMSELGIQTSPPRHQFWRPGRAEKWRAELRQIKRFYVTHMEIREASEKQFERIIEDLLAGRREIM